MVRVLAAHGTKDPTGRATIVAIADAVADRVGPVRIAWLDVLTPSLSEVLGGIDPDEPVVVVPLLLSEGFHDRTDIPAIVAGAAPQAHVVPVLGDDPRIVEALAGRLTEAGWAGEPVVVGGAGSARETWHDLAGRVTTALGALLDTPTALGVLSGPGRSVADTVAMLAGPSTQDRPRVAVSAYLIAEGFFHNRLVTSGGDLTTDPIGTHPRLIDLLAQRFAWRANNGRMATTAFRGDPIQTVGDLPSQGDPAPDFAVTGADLSEIKSADLAGRRVVLNIFPSIDTPVCATSVRTFNELAAGLENTTVLCVSADLPFALGRFCGAEGIDNVSSGSTFRSSFGADFGVTMADGPLQGLLARSVVVLDTDGTVLHSELVPEIGQEPNYDAATGALT